MPDEDPKTGALAKLMGALVWEGKLFVPQKAQCVTCDQCAFKWYPSLCLDIEFTKKTVQVAGSRCRNHVWIAVHNHDRQD